MAKKVFFGNYKGGVGKTATVYEIGALFADKHKKKVLLIDLDPQGSLSRICSHKYNESLEQSDVTKSLNYLISLYSEYLLQATTIEVLEISIKTPTQSIKSSIKTIPDFNDEEGQLDYIATILHLKDARLNDLAAQKSNNSLNALIMPLIIKDIEKECEYDYILFDCPPTSNLLIQSVFALSDYYLIPTIGDEMSTSGVSDYITEIESSYSKFAYEDKIGGILLDLYFGNPSKLIGILETMYKNRATPTHLAILDSLNQSIKAIGVNSEISECKDSEGNRVHSSDQREHLFKTQVKHLDNRSDPNNFGIPLTLNLGEIHDEYIPIAEAIIEILRDK